MSFMDKAKDFADSTTSRSTRAWRRPATQVDQRTGDKYSSQIDKGVDEAQKRTGDGDTAQ